MPEHRAQTRHIKKSVFCLLCSVFLSLNIVFADELTLQELIDEALKNNHEILVSETKSATAGFKIPQAESLPDPMLMLGYQNEGFRQLYSFSKSPDSMWMFSASQMFPFPGKLSLKGEIAARDAEVTKAMANTTKLKIISRVKELYYELFFAYKNIALIKNRANLFLRIEDAAIARYSTGMGSEQEVLMSQTEKYMLLEKEEMLKQKIQSIEAMLNTTIGREVNSPLGRPAEPILTTFNRGMHELIKIAYNNSSEIISREKMVTSAETRIEMAKKEYYPDFTVNATYFARNADYPDMWSLSASVNIPLFYKTKQRQAVNEANSALSEAKHELEAVKQMISSSIRDNYSMAKASERLMDLYKTALIPKTYQDFEAAIAVYITGKIDAITVITRLKSLIDYEILYWQQFIEREKAIARLEAITGIKQEQK
ncbi:MAG: TolC family protein [Thermodesulfovibrionales bacterium]|nr:TolC family protein [Thermodesulfovibrionales bacterium]